MERLLAAGRDVILCELQEGQAVLALTPHVLGPQGQERQRTQVVTLEFHRITHSRSASLTR